MHFENGDRVVCIKEWCDNTAAVGVAGRVIIHDDCLGVVFDRDVDGHSLHYHTGDPEYAQSMGRGWWFPSECSDEYLAYESDYFDPVDNAPAFDDLF